MTGLGYILGVLVWAYVTMITINLNVFVENERLLRRNRAMILVVLNPFSILRKTMAKLSIMSDELQLVENVIYGRRSVLIEKNPSAYVMLNKCTKCNTPPIFGAEEWSFENSVCIKCKCGSYYLECTNNGKKFTWPFPNKLMYGGTNSASGRNIQAYGEYLAKRCLTALTFEWNRRPDMSQRDVVLVKMKEWGFTPDETFVIRHERHVVEIR